MGESNPDHAGAIAPPPLIFGVPLLIGVYENTSKPLSVLPPRFAMITGGVMILAGLILCLAAMIQIGRAHTALVPYRPTTTIVETWPYSFTRNPIYLSLALIYVGISIFLNTLWPLLLLPLVLIVVQRGVIEREERYLAGKFGSDYVDYKTRVRRWI